MWYLQKCKYVNGCKLSKGVATVLLESTMLISHLLGVVVSNELTIGGRSLRGLVRLDRVVTGLGKVRTSL